MPQYFEASFPHLREDIPDDFSFQFHIFMEGLTDTTNLNMIFRQNIWVSFIRSSQPQLNQAVIVASQTGTAIRLINVLRVPVFIAVWSALFQFVTIWSVTKWFQSS